MAEARPAAAADGSLLDAFVRDGTGEWGWERAGPAERGSSGALHTLRLVSQTWRGQPWTHTLRCVVPAGAAPDVSGCLLYITGGGDHAAALAWLEALAARTGAPAAVLGDVPNQPLFGDLREDALIAHTFERFLDSGDPSWPLLLPMTRAAVRAMDALQAFLRGEGLKRVDGFMVSGASKRGWTTYLTAAADARVRGIAPMVYDNLDMPTQLRRQREVFGGGYSPEIADYTERGLPERIEATEGRALVAAVDPFAYRARLRMPKWLILGTNDPYWPADALSLYHDALPGETFVTYAPNTGHGLGAPARVMTALAALWQRAFGDPAEPGPLAPLQAQWRREQDRVHLRLWGPPAASRATLWVASRPTLDFREAEWSMQAPLSGGPPWNAELDLRAHGPVVGVFAELEVAGPSGAGPVALDTPIRLFGP